MSANYLAIQALGFATGSVLFVLLAALAFRAEERAGEPHNGARAAVLCFFWNFGSLGQFTALLCGLGQGSPAWRLSAAVAWCSIAMLPTAVSLLLKPAAWARGWQAHAGRSFLWVSRGVAVLLTLGFIVTALSSRLSIAATVPGAGRLVVGFNTVMRMSAYNLVLHVLGGTVLVRGAAQLSHVGRAYSRTILLWMIGLGSLLMISIHAGLGAGAESALETITQQSTIPVAILSLIFLGQFRFADVFVKRSLVILAAVAAALIYLLLVVGPVVGLIRKSAPYPNASVWLAATILWGLLLLLFPSVERATSRAADRWLFRRPDYRVLSERFSRDSDTVQDERELFALAEQMIRAAVDVADIQVEPARAAGNEINDGGAGARIGPPWGRTHPCVRNHPARSIRLPESLDAEQMRSRAAQARVPIRVTGAIRYFIVATPGERGRKLLSDELRFLSVLADRIGRRIESFGFERELREREIHEVRLRQLLAEANLKALRAQLNPHFLFNTLNTILDLIGSEPEKAEAMTERLADVFRHVMVRTERAMISVGEEIEFLSRYLEIERVRFGDRLIVLLDVDPLVSGEPIPSLILQPLVENAIKHGLARKMGAGTIRIAAVVEGDVIHLTVEDDGIGWPADEMGVRDPGPAGTFDEIGLRNPVPARSGVELGLRNVRDRLAAVYGDRAQMSVSSVPGLGASVRITITKRDVDDSSNRRRSLGEVSTAETPGRAS